MTTTSDPHAPELAIAMPRTGDTEVALEVDLSAERPAATMHGLQPNRASRGLFVAAATGGLLALVIAMVAGGGDDADAVPVLEPQLRASLDSTVAVVEAVRTDAITVAYTRSLAAAPVARRGKPHAGASTTTAVAPSAVSGVAGSTREPATHTSTASGAARPSHRQPSADVIQSLPAAPAADTPSAPAPSTPGSGASGDPSATRPAEPPAEPAPAPTPAPLPGVGDPEDDAPVEADEPPMPS
ncbi:MAG: hypothetical protein IPH07_30455 [Deltaproteobacteria bacterium]|nr:hypothetical protein [Deltaproteobacteria bacterium]MBK8715237.1 hypothetical protein [Deltaproteobacteria bacterium]MBP7285057.1 hypothetical protein [Nannocystaceae bacterium]